MIALLAAAALAEPLPIVLTGTTDSVEAVHLTATVQLSEPGTFRMAADLPTFEAATAFVASVDPDLLAVRQGPSPVLYLGARPARIVHRSADGCVVGFVPGRLSEETVTVFFGSSTLPERVDAEHGRRELEAARAAGLPSTKPRRTTDLAVSDEGALFETVAALQSHCDQVSSQ